MLQHSRLTVVNLLAALVLVGFACGLSRAAEPLEYNRDIRPILAENCFACHGPDSASRKADLRLDKRDVAIEMGAIAPNQPDQSGLVARIDSTDADEVMPPPATKKTLTPEQKAKLKSWIASGAAYQPHWSLIAPQRPELPAVKNSAWVRNPIDRFILAKLEEHGLAPAKEADRRTLARRASLDLIGLPPKPEEVEAFVNDTSADAYEKYVDKLMQSPHWGEHRGRYWLDAARYADTHGIHMDNFREAWAFRDWVIGAFNRNVPFDRFTIEQLAGDLLPNRTLDQQVASGFNRCNITTSEGGAINEEYLVLYARDRTETTSQVWMGLTAGCAVCHDHKFDPLVQKEFYSLAAYFNNTTQPAMDGNIKDTPPILPVPLAADRPRMEQIAAELPAVRQQLEARKGAARADFDKWIASASMAQLAAAAPNDMLLHLPLGESSGAAVQGTVSGQPREFPVTGALATEPGHVAASSFKTQPQTDLAVADMADFDSKDAFSCGAWVKLDKPNLNGSVVARMDDQHDYRGWDIWIDNGRLASHIINKWDQNALKIVSNNGLNVGGWNHVLVTYDGSSKAAGMKLYINGVLQATSVAVDRLSDTIRASVPFKIGRRHTTGQLSDTSIQDVRLFGRVLSPAEATSLASMTRAAYLVGKPADQRNDAEKNELYGLWLAALDKPTQELSAKVTALEQEDAAIRARGTVAHVMQERPEMPEAFILFRGEYDKRRDKVTPNTPAMLPPMPDDLPRNRLGLAQWLLRPEHPLTARVTVNRFWQEVFGTGLVRTAGDFGVSGELPSHPELLDWLAVDFRESGWDIKRFFRQMVTSAAYRQSAEVTPEKLEKDRANRLVSRGPRFRMDAEMVRDYALASSGLLVPKLGGPSVKPYQPDGVWEAVAMIGSNTRDYVRDKGENLYRRSMYTFLKRSAPPAMLEIFNAPSRETCTVRRERTNTPLQALVTLNDPQFVEAARMLAQHAIKEGGNEPATRVDFIARRLLCRPLRAEESKVVDASLAELTAYYQQNAEEARQLVTVGDMPADATIEPQTLAAWTMLANELLNLDEVLNK